jgi:hypothetical protein
MHRTVLSPVACLDLPHFSTLPHKWNDFNFKKVEYKMGVLIFSTSFSELLLILEEFSDTVS